ncbi:MAG TPA: histidine kinase dimerization/phospho-acceptor domain-containing protein, partial [Chitinophagales bacterium]
MALHRLIGVCKETFLALDNRLALNIRSRLIIAISILFTVIMSGVFLWSYYSIEQYQKSEFSQQLADKAVTVADIMSRNEKRGVNFIAQLDKETRNTLYEERIFIYNETEHLIYSSAEDTNHIFLQKALSLLEKKEVALLKNNDDRVYGKRFENGKQRLYIIISAHDFYGTKTLKNVRNILGLIFIVGILLLVIFMSGIVQQLLQPLYDLNEEIDNLNENNLRQNISDPQWASPEIIKLTKSYNRMLVRIADAFDNQNQFVQYASHELRTPLAVMLLELENALLKTKDEASVKVLGSLKEELEKLIDLTNSLLMLYK